VPKTVNIQGFGVVDFPDDFTDQQIQDAIEIDILKTRTPAAAANLPVTSIDQAVRAGGSLPGITPGVAGMPKPAAPARLRSSPWERARAGAEAEAFNAARTAIPQTPMVIPAQQQIINQATGAEMQDQANQSARVAAEAAIPQPVIDFAAALPGAMTSPLRLDKNPVNRVKFALQNSAEDPEALSRELESVPESERTEILRSAVDALRSDFQGGAANYVEQPVEGEPGPQTAAKAFARTLYGLASPQGLAEMAALGGVGQAARAAVNSPKVVAALRNSPRLRQGIDVAGAVAVPGGMAVKTGADAIEAGIDASNADGTEQVDKMTQAITSALMSMGLLGAATKVGSAVRGQYVPENMPAFVPRRKFGQAASKEAFGEDFRPTRVDPQAAVERAAELRERGSNLAADDILQKADPNSYPITIGKETFTVMESEPGTGRPGAEILDAKGERVFGGTRQQAMEWVAQRLQPSQGPGAAHGAVDTTRGVQVVQEGSASIGRPKLDAAQAKLLDAVDFDMGKGARKSIAKLRAETGLDPAEFDAVFRSLYGADLIQSQHGDPSMMAEFGDGNYVLDNQGRPLLTAVKQDATIPSGSSIDGSQDVSGQTQAVPRTGHKTTVLVPGEETEYDAQYAVRELDELNASHNGLNFQPNPNYQLKNERDYSVADNQERVVLNSSPRLFNPRFLITDNPDALNGPPVIDEGRNTVGGNSRVMILQRTYGRGDMSYRNELIRRAADFGINPADVEGMKNPVLVRIIPDESDTGSAKAIRDANKQGTAALTAAERAMADANQVTPELLDYLQGQIELQGPEGTLRDALNDRGAVEIVNKLVEAGIFTPQEKPDLVDAEVGKLTDTGRTRIEGLLLGRLFRDTQQFRKTPETIRDRLGSVIGAIARVSGSEWDIADKIQEALDILEYARAHGVKDVRLAIGQVDMFGNAPQFSEEAVKIAETLRQGITKVRKAFKTYAADFHIASDPTASLFGTPSQSESFEQAFTVQEEAKPAPETEVETTVVETPQFETPQPAQSVETPADSPQRIAPKGKRAQHAAILEALDSGRAVSISDIAKNTGIPAKQLAARMTELASEGRIDLKPSTEDAAWAEPPTEGMLEAPDGTRYYGAGLTEAEAARQQKLAARRRSQKGAVKLDFFTGRDPNEQDPNDPEFKFSDPAVQERIRLAGKPTPPRVEEEASWRQIGRVYRHLPQGKYPVLTFELKRLEKNGSIASAKAQEALRGITLGLKRNQFKAFRMQVVVDDLIATIDRFIKDGKVTEAELQGEELPFGFTIDTLRKAQAEIRDWNSKFPEVQKALEKRERVWQNVRNDFLTEMDKVGIDMRSKFQNRDYFRHRVLTHLQDKVSSRGVGRQPGLQTPNRRSHFLARGLNSLDYSTNYIESEYEVMSQIIADTQKARMIAYLKAPANGLNIIEELKTEARRLNVQAMMDHFRSKGLQDEEIYAIINWRRPSIVETMGELAFSGGLPDDGGRFAPLVKELASAYQQSLEEAGGKMKLSSKPEEYSKFIDWMRQYLENAGTARTETRRAVDIATRARRIPQQMLEEILKERLVLWSDLIPDTHKEWAPSDGNTFFMVNSIPEQLAKEIMESISGEVGVSRDDLRKVLALGPKKEPLVLPREVAVTLEDLRTDAQRNAAYQMTRKALGLWKSYQLVSPLRLVKYNLRNLSGDAEVTLAGNPRAFRKAGQAARELWDWYRNRKATPELEAWMDRGGFQSSLVVAELGDLQNDSQFKQLMEIDGKLDGQRRSYNPWTLWEQNVGRPVSDFREGILRYANFLEYLDQANAGKLRNYGASRPSDVDALKAPADKAYKLSNDLLGAYDEITEGGRVIRDLAIPFWSFQELNFRRYKWLIKNAAHDEKLAGLVGRKLLGTAAIRSPYIAYRLGSMFLKIAGMWALLQAWNYLMFSKEEKQLPQSIRSKPHIVLGSGEDGKVRYFSRLGNLPDLLEWFDPEDHLPAVKDALNGKIGPAEFAKKFTGQLLMAPVEKVASTSQPYVTVPIQLGMGKRLFPDIQRPRQIRDRAEFVAEQFQMQGLYQYLTNKPTGPKGSAFGNALKSAVIYESDPKESAYYDIRDLRTQFMLTKGVAEQPPGVAVDPKKEAAYNLKIAVRRQDAEAFRHWLQVYYNAGGTRDMLEKSAETFDPLYRMRKDHRKEFIASLNAEDRNRLALANQYYKEIFKSGRLQDYLKQNRDIRRTK